MTFLDRIKETSISTGTGTFTLAGAVVGYKTFTNGTYKYCIVNNTETEWEVGEGTVASGVLTRTTIEASSNAGSVVNFSAGTKYVFNTVSAAYVNSLVPYTGATSNLNLGNFNVYANAYFNGFSSVTASGTQIVLTISSPPVTLVSGSGGQTIKLPDATTLPKGTIFSFNNNQTTGVINVNNNSNTLVKSVQSGAYLTLELIDNPNAAGTWDAHFQTPSNVSWSTNTFDYTGSITSATWNGAVVQPNRGGTGQSTFTDGQLLIGNSSGNTLTKATLTAGSGISISNGNGSISISSSFASLTTTGSSGAATLVSGVLNIPQYQGALTLTTTGTSGAATFVGNTLNIPQYAAGISGSGTAGQVTYWSGTSAVTGSSSFTWDNTNTQLTLGSSTVNPIINFAASANASTVNFIINNPSFGGTLLSFRNSADTRYVRITGINFDISTSGAISAGSSLNAGNISISASTISGFNTAAIVMNGDTMSITNRNTATSTMSIVSGGDILFQNRPSATAITIAKFAQTTGNLLLQNGGTFTDAGYRLDVNGTGATTGALRVTGGLSLFQGGKMTIAACTTSYASLNIPSGTAPTSPANGDMWNDGTNVYFRIGGTTKTFTLV